MYISIAMVVRFGEGGGRRVECGQNWGPRLLEHRKIPFFKDNFFKEFFFKEVLPITTLC